MRTRRPRSHVEADAVRAAVAAVPDPEIGRPLAELGMLDGVDVDRAGRVVARIRLTTAACPLQDELRQAVTAAAHAVTGVNGVDVTFDVMTKPQRMRLAAELRDRSGQGVRGFASGTAVFAIASGKGGVGKSSITANLAAALAAEGKQVGVLDADVWGYSMPQLFGVHRPPVALQGMMLPINAHGVRLMSTGFFVDDEPIVWRGPMLDKALHQFFDDVYWGQLDILFVDLPPGTGDVALSLLALVPEAQLIVVTTPQPAAHRVAARVGQMAHDARMPLAGVVENMSTLHCANCGAETPLFGTGGGSQLAEQLHTPLLGRVPLDVSLRESGDAGVPVVLCTPAARSARELRRIAESLPVHSSLVGRRLPVFPA